MKIFNWVQRRLNPSIVLSKDEQGRSIIKRCEETQSPVFINSNNGWKDRILTIGTLGLGCDPLTPFIHLQNQNILKEEEEEYEDEHQHHHNCGGEAKQVPCRYLRVTNINYDDDDGGDGDTENESEEEDEEVNPLIPTTLEQDDYLEWNATNHPAAEDDEMMMEKISKKRTTLADLFSADSDYWTSHSMDLKHKDDGQALRKSNSIKKQASAKTKSMTFAKKLIQPVGENSRPIQKIRGLMKKMLKRKIHPELENKITSHQLTNGSDFLTSKKKHIEGGGDESLSLLPTCSDPII